MTVMATIGATDVSGDVMQIDIRRESLSFVGTWEMILRDLTGDYIDAFAPYSAVHLGVDEWQLMAGYVDDVQPYVNPDHPSMRFLKIMGRDYGLDLILKFITKGYYQLKGDDIIADALTTAGSEISYTSPSTAPLISQSFKRTYLASGFREICMALNYECYVVDSKSLYFFPVGDAAFHTTVDLLLEGLSTDNILEFSKGESVGRDIFNHIVIGGGTLKDHWTEGNATDWTPGTNCTISNESTLYPDTFLAGDGSLKFLKTTGWGTLQGTLDFSSGLYNYTVLDLAQDGTGEFIVKIHYTGGPSMVQVSLEDSSGNVIRFIRFTGILQDLPSDTWVKIDFPVGESAQIVLNPVNQNGVWWLESGSLPFSWDQVKKIKFRCGGDVNVDSYFYLDDLKLPIDTIARTEDPTSIATYGKRMYYDNRSDVKSQILLDEIASSSLSKKMAPMKTLKVVAIGQIYSQYAGQSLDVKAPPYGIADLTKYRVLSLHHRIVNKENASYPWKHITEYDLVSHELSPTVQEVDPSRLRYARAPSIGFVTRHEEILKRLTVIEQGVYSVSDPGVLIIPTMISDPASPLVGQIWIRTDL
jgi:hypothetical protein